MLKAFRLYESLPSVEVRLWLRPGVYSAKLDEDYAVFHGSVSAAARVAAAAARLYYFRGAVELAGRIPINDSAALRDFTASGARCVWVFEGGPHPPEVSPDDAAGGSAAPPPTNGSARSSAQEDAFRSAVLRRDGSACVLCGLADTVGNESRLEAAHVIAARTPQPVLDGVMLLNAYDTNNGITLCGDCHHWYDRFMWCARPDGTAAVADALCALAGCKRWAGLRGRALRVPTEALLRAAWPLPHFWQVQERLYEAATAALHAFAESHLFACEKCGARCATQLGLRRHKCAGPQAFTPIFARAFPDAAAAAGGGRAIDFTDEEAGITEDEGEEIR